MKAKAKKDAKKSDNLLIEPEKRWTEYRLGDHLFAEQRAKVGREYESSLRKEARSLYDSEKRAFDRIQSTLSNTENAWIKTVLAKGTFSDKLSANAKLVQQSAVHNFSCLQNMVQMVTVKAKRGCIAAMEMLKDLFLGDILLSKSKLRTFAEQIPYLDNNPTLRKQQLILFHFEDCVLQLYRQFVEAVEKVSHDSVDASKNKAVNIIFELLCESPEQEHFLLEKLTNKLGDPCSKLAAHVSYLLAKLVNEHHPAMKLVVVNEIERVLYRPNITEKAQYYALCFLNEIIFDDDDKDVADKIVNLYFDFFKACLKKGEVNNKMMNALLTGVNRTFPYSKLKPEVFETHMNTFFKIIHYVNFNTAIQAMNLMFNLMSYGNTGSLSDRFYGALYRSLSQFQFDNCSRKALFFNLVYRAIKKDPVSKRVKAFLKRLLQVALHSSSQISAGIIILTSQILKVRPEIEFRSANVFNDDSEDFLENEKYDDVKEDSDRDNDEFDENSKDNFQSKSSWIHLHNFRNKECSGHYDIHCRNPLYANAEEVLWEENLLCKHYHPSVSLFANNLLHGISTEYDGDPLSDFTIKNFLDRFVFRNPKKITKEQKSRSRQQSIFRRSYKKQAPVIDANFVQIPEERIPVEERFIYKYLSNRKLEKHEDDNESVTSEEFERILEKFEPGFEKDLAEEISTSSKRAKKNNSKIDSIDEDFEDDVSELENLSEDEEYNKNFEGLDEELQDIFEEDDAAIPVKYKKRGHSEDISALFASADKFAELLEKNSESENDSDEKDSSDSEEEESGKEKKSGKRKKRRFFKGRKKRK
ncbi:CCAAT/enhancer-binding protein zeta-like protein [Dinothrombium tinctorium]|uniref:CCAAT/enhancer-binding protein zeta-like protein n=1 Tax=Dinothrombium tinctorium TaxID=1965070 RepID=A0A3S3PIZ9_9ACAR|nr:CCAAT/enhancer-binding protein zeta-like protein [Dinothrombium tinctorium]RWS10534.1 CCAAT/enhancer-binding protein zeta-like protein [Dinothrombium tinctorium]